MFQLHLQHAVQTVEFRVFGAELTNLRRQVRTHQPREERLLLVAMMNGARIGEEAGRELERAFLVHLQNRAGRLLREKLNDAAELLAAAVAVEQGFQRALGQVRTRWGIWRTQFMNG